MNNVIILGAGPAGLGAAYHLNKSDQPDWRLFERNSHVGGLSASFVDEKGFTWDIGGHVLFSHYDYFDTAIEEGREFIGVRLAFQLFKDILFAWHVNHASIFPAQFTMLSFVATPVDRYFSMTATVFAST
ncbi:MAG: hypothetical protein EHM79_12930 [Geobacter sp.]|nr:MAG: hypothetical protein EHM79_12930 [Geobacter sp.]